MKHLSIALLCGLAALLPLPAQSSSPAEPGFTLRNSIGAMMHPTGAVLTSKLYYTEPLYENLRGKLWDSARIEVGLVNRLSPAHDEAALDLFVEPVAFFDLRANLGLRRAYTALGYGFVPRSSYEDGYRSTGGLPAESRTGFLIQLNPRLKLAFGPLVLLNSFTWSSYSFYYNSSDEPHYYYEPTHDVIIRERDSIYDNTSMALYDVPISGAAGLLAGLSYELLYVDGSSYVSQRLSVMGVLRLPFPRRRWSFDAAVQLGVYPENRYYELADGYLSPALRVGVSRKL